MCTPVEKLFMKCIQLGFCKIKSVYSLQRDIIGQTFVSCITLARNIYM